MASHRGWGGRAVSGGWDSGDRQPSLPSHSPPSSHGSKPGSARSTTARAAVENRGRPSASKRVGVQDRPNSKRASKAAPNKRARLPASLLGNGTAEEQTETTATTTAASTTHRVLPDAAVTRAIVQRALENPQSWSIASLEASQRELAAHFSSKTHDAAVAYPLTLSSQPERPDILTLCWAEAFGPDRGWSRMAPPSRSLLQLRPQVCYRVERAASVP